VRGDGLDHAVDVADWMVRYRSNPTCGVVDRHNKHAFSAISETVKHFNVSADWIRGRKVRCECGHVAKARQF
jgi:hypothetical protein